MTSVTTAFGLVFIYNCLWQLEAPRKGFTIHTEEKKGTCALTHIYTLTYQHKTYSYKTYLLLHTTLQIIQTATKLRYLTNTTTRQTYTIIHTTTHYRPPVHATSL